MMTRPPCVECDRLEIILRSPKQHGTKILAGIRSGSSLLGVVRTGIDCALHLQDGFSGVSYVGDQEA